MIQSKSLINIPKVAWLASAMLFIIVSSCKKAENKKKFDWVRPGNKMYYDYYTPIDTVKDFRYLEIFSNRFYELDPTNASVYEAMFYIIQRDLVIKKDGLYGLACKSCGFLGCAGEFEYLYAPNVPTLNQEIPQYGCSTTADSYKIKIIEINKSITVPKGTFNTYVMLHRNGDKSYWDPDNGLIMYDRYKCDGSLIGSLKLSR